MARYPSHVAQPCPWFLISGACQRQERAKDRRRAGRESDGLAHFLASRRHAGRETALLSVAASLLDARKPMMLLLGRRSHRLHDGVDPSGKAIQEPLRITRYPRPLAPRRSVPVHGPSGHVASHVPDAGAITTTNNPALSRLNGKGQAQGASLSPSGSSTRTGSTRWVIPTAICVLGVLRRNDSWRTLIRTTVGLSSMKGDRFSR